MYSELTSGSVYQVKYFIKQRFQLYNFLLLVKGNFSQNDQLRNSCFNEAEPIYHALKLLVYFVNLFQINTF